MEGDLIRINRWLLPLSWLYGAGVGFRNMLYDLRLLHSQSYDIPIINVGNITVGGTGKTPHVEYLLRLLSQQFQVAVLSRGYKRRSSGYVLAETDTPMEQLGDEPWQMKQKFPQAYVAVDANRRRGINRLCTDEKTRNVEVILLDDAYQHRKVKPGINILLVDYHRMITEDCLLPAGRLRESARRKERANIVIVTKCPANLQPMGYRVLQHALGLRPYQQLYFSTLHYGTLQSLDGKRSKKLENLRGEEQNVLLLTGIGSPEQMEQDMRAYISRLRHLAYPDHHFFSASDAQRINAEFEALPKPRIIITTEKDATRLKAIQDSLSQETRDNTYILPIEVGIMRNNTNTFNEKIIGYVRKNSRNSILAQKPDARKA